MNCIYAMTETGGVGYPPYISVNEHSPDSYSVTVRSPGKLLGESSWISLSEEQLKTLATNIFAFLAIKT